MCNLKIYKKNNPTYLCMRKNAIHVCNSLEGGIRERKK